MKRIITSIIILSMLAGVGFLSYKLVSKSRDDWLYGKASSEFQQLKETMEEESTEAPKDFGAKSDIGREFIEKGSSVNYSKLVFSSAEEFLASYNKLVEPLSEGVEVQDVYFGDLHQLIKKYSTEGIEVFIDNNGVVFMVVINKEIDIEDMVGDEYEANIERGNTVITRSK